MNRSPYDHKLYVDISCFLGCKEREKRKPDVRKWSANAQIRYDDVYTNGWLHNGGYV